MYQTASSDILRTKVEVRNLLRFCLVLVFGIFATTLPQPDVLGRLPLQFLLKDEMGVTRGQMAAFFFWSGLLDQFFPPAKAENVRLPMAPVLRDQAR